MHDGATLDFGTAVLGVDPGTRSLGVCLTDGGGRVVETWSVRSPAGRPLQRLSFIHGGVARVFDQARGLLDGREPLVLIEDGVYRARPKVCAMLGEVRGAVMAEAWRRGWPVRLAAPISWKSAVMTKAERAMAKKKNRAYVDYWNRKLGLDCQTADVVDAVLIAAFGVKGRG